MYRENIFYALIYSLDGHNTQAGPDQSHSYPTWIQGHKHLSHFPLLYQAINRELDQKWSSLDINQ